MAAPRLPFLYPKFIRHLIEAEAHSTSRATTLTAQRRAFHTHGASRYPPQQERYGTANQPKTPSEPAGTDSKPAKNHRKAELVNEDEEQEPRRREFYNGNGAQSAESDAQVQDEKARGDASEGQPEEPMSNTALQISQRPLERVLHMDPPNSSRDGEDQHPHMKPPPYVHHFDTYTLVDDLKKGGFSQQQSITVMKAVRGLLAENMQMARDGLVSKSNVENESYLFKAACSELRTEVQNNRSSGADKMRSERAHLQHEVDILGQKVTQETLTLKDELKGMFDDRKMLVRQEQRTMENMIQELNYKIQIHLTGESKGDVEALRWFLTRRAALFIGSFACELKVSLPGSSRLLT